MRCVPFRCPHWDGILWWAPTEHDARQELKAQGVTRGDVWTAGEVAMLKESSPSPEDVKQAIEVKAIFGGKLEGYREATPPAMDCRQVHPSKEDRIGRGTREQKNKRSFQPDAVWEGDCLPGTCGKEAGHPVYDPREKSGFRTKKRVDRRRRRS